ncbi:E3 ubiquitin-protein ligase dbl4-like [Oryza glaberrima]|uniref:RBR-type E3 ubiquitin transferase n=1 Tax=Oryza glaberrima TaxID=4538 RepID=I1R1F5_ORYGL|nr:E3 ubiquitin-protein ligase dbl4-like [Oryza glaberrima]
MASEAAQEPNQEFLDACMPSPSSAREAGRRRVPPLSDDDIGWFHCEACDEPRLLYDRRRVSGGCAHELCVACVVGHVEARVAAGEVPVRCPFQFPAGSSHCDAVVHPEDCKDLLYIGDFDAWCVALCELAVGGPGAFARCPNPDCGERLDTGAGGERAVSGATCLRCSRAFCLRCEQPWDERHRDGEGCVPPGNGDAAAP